MHCIQHPFLSFTGFIFALEIIRWIYPRVTSDGRKRVSPVFHRSRYWLCFTLEVRSRTVEGKYCSMHSGAETGCIPARVASLRPSLRESAATYPWHEGNGYVYVLAPAYIISLHSGRVWRCMLRISETRDFRAIRASFSFDAETRGTCGYRFANEILRGVKNSVIYTY